MAHVYAVRAVLPGMLERGTGYLVHTASIAGILTSHGNVTYAITKHAVVGLAEWLSITYHHRGIRVSLIAPLGVRTPMLERADPRFAAAVAGPIKEPEDVALSVVDAIRAERFLVLSDPIAQRGYSARRTIPSAGCGACAECSSNSKRDGSPRLAGLLRPKDDVDVDGVPASADARRLCCIVRVVYRERTHQRFLDPEDDVGFEVPALRIEHVGRDREVPVRRHHEVDVRRPPRMPSRCLQHPADRTVSGDRVIHRSDGSKREGAVAIGPKPAAQVLR